METQQDKESALDPNPIVSETPVPESEPEKLQTLDCSIPIEEGVENITLVGHSLSNEEKNDDKDDGESESESGSEDSESESSSSSSSSYSDSDADSESESSSSSDSDEEEEESRHDVDVEVEDGEVSGSDDGEKMVNWSLVDEVIDHDDDDVGGPIRSKNEIENLPPVPPVEVTIEPHHQLLPVGVVMSIIDAKVIVEGVEKHDPLNEGSILWLTESRKPLGLVDEIFGPVKNPYYVVRYNSEKEVPAQIHGGTLVSFVPEFADCVLNNKDLCNKGYDASGANDEELSDEIEFSDDEKEAEYKRTQRMTKRGINDQNPGKRKNNRKKYSSEEHAISTIPAAPSLHNGNSLPFPGTGQGPLGGSTTVPPFPPLNTAPNFATNGVWINRPTLLQQPQPALLHNGFSTNGISCYPQNTQISHQLPVPGLPFQQQLHPDHLSLIAAMLPGVQPNLYAQPTYAQGPVGQSQMAFGLSSPFPQIQSPILPAQQGFPSTELQPERTLNLHSSSISGGPPQFHPGSSANRGRKTFHGAGRKGWRPAK